MTWLQRLGRRRHVEDRLDAELRDHFDRLVEDAVAQGTSKHEALRQARLEFGGLDQIKEECRDARGTQWVHDSASDVRFGLRLMARDPWFTAIVIVSLALGIGVCSLAFTITDAYYFRGLPVTHPERMLYVRTTDAQGREGFASHPDYLDWQAALPDVEMAAYKVAPVSVGQTTRAADRLSGAYVSANIFQLLDVMPVAGRLFSADDGLPSRAAVALVSHRLWTNTYAQDRSLLGSLILVDKRSDSSHRDHAGGFRVPVPGGPLASSGPRRFGQPGPR